MISSKRALAIANDLLANVSVDDMVIIQGDAIYDYKELTSLLSANIYVMDIDMKIRGLEIGQQQLIREQDVAELVKQTPHIIRV